MTATMLMTQGEIDADRRAWLAARRKGLGASEVGQMLDIAPREHGGPFALYWSKIEGFRAGVTDEMTRGTYLEPYVADRFMAEHPGVTLRPGGLYAHPEHPWLMATFDRQDDDGPVQIKTSASEDEWGSNGEARMPPHIRAQALTEMEIAGADVVKVPCLFILPWTVRTYVIERDAAAQRDIDFIIGEGQAFMARLESHDPPEIDASPRTTDTLRALFPGLEDRAVRIPLAMARRYRRAAAAKREADARHRLAQNQILERLGNATLAVARDPAEGRERDDYLVRVASRTAAPRQAYTVPACERVDRLNPAGWARGK